tara:strand:+ start:453 stop:866 length:414 start_codon:yes stop_codon:yes gene_type:complete
MAKLPYTWSKVDRGDIISFIYETKEGRRLRRTILVLEPDRKKLLHGIQLEVSNVATNRELKKLLEMAGKTEVVDEDKKIFRVELDGSSKQIYQKLKRLIKRHDIYRTYSLKKAKKSQVFLEDLRLPPSFVKELIGEN